MPRFTAALTLGALVMLGSAASAQDADTDYRRFCSGDYQRLCGTYSPGSPQVEQCFQARYNELSKRCRDTIAKYNGKRR